MASAAPNHFTFTLGTPRDPSQTKVTVYEARSRQQSVGLSSGSRSQREVFLRLLNRLNPAHIQRDPNPTLTLVNEGSHRIDSQPATAVYRNIHYQYQSNSYAATTVQKGAELCFAVGYETILLRYINAGLRSSFGITEIFHIFVTIERRIRHEKKWKEIPYSADDVESVRRDMVTKMMNNKKQKENRMKSGKNTEKQKTKTDRIDRVAAAIERIVGDYSPVARAMTVDIAKVSLLLGTFMTAERQREGSWPGAITKVVDNQRDFDAAVGLDADRLIKEIKKALDMKPKHLTDADLESLRREKIQLRKEIAATLEESPVYGTHSESSFDESDLADLEDIKQIRVRSADLINGIQIVYRSLKGDAHGGDGGKFETFDLEDDEKITIVSGTMIRDVKMLSSLTFSTCFGKEKTFGKQRGEHFIFEMTNGSYLGAIKGYEKNRAKGKPTPGYDGKVNMLLAVGFIPKC